MEFTNIEIDFIQKKRPQFRFKPVPSLDSVVVKFLKKYEVYVEPPKNRNIADGALTGVTSAMAGPDVGGDIAIIQGQNKQTKIQQWTSWKQWALDHNDFEAFRSEYIDKPKTYNLKILESLKDPKVQKELAPLIKEFYENRNKEEKTRELAVVVILGVILVTFLGVTGVPVIVDLFDRDSIEVKNEWKKLLNK